MKLFLITTPNNNNFHLENFILIVILKSFSILTKCFAIKMVKTHKNNKEAFKTSYILEKEMKYSKILVFNFYFFDKIMSNSKLINNSTFLNSIFQQTVNQCKKVTFSV